MSAEAGALLISDPDSNSFRGEIRVASRIIDYLSSGLYPSPAACLKELINNSYDADARQVDVFVKPDADRIIIADDGTGMNRAEFVKHFERISESHKRDGAEHTKSGRPKIGKIGIGFIAANEICEVMEIFSTKKNSTELLHVIIDFAEMRKPIEERRREGTDFVKADYYGEVLYADRKAHYTQIFLTRIRGEAQDIMAGARPQHEGSEARSLYGLSTDSVAAALKPPSVSTWKDFDTYSETMLQIGLNVPVPYHQSWLPEPLRTNVADVEQAVKLLDFRVLYDGTELRKPIIFSPPKRGSFISRFEFSGNHISAKGYFYAQHGTIKPIELHGLLVRIRHAAVGEFDDSFWGFSQSEFSLIQRWVSAEIWADDRLERAMNIDRRTLRIADPAYVELREAIHSHLRKVLKRARSEIYEAGNTVRNTERASDAERQMVAFAKEVVAPIAPKAAKALTATWKKVAEKPTGRKALLRKFTVTELYAAVLEVAEQVMEPDQLEKFIKLLTERLSR